MEPSEELKHIAMEIVHEMAGGLEASQYWGLRLRLIADKIDSLCDCKIGKVMFPKKFCSWCGRREK